MRFTMNHSLHAQARVRGIGAALLALVCLMGWTSAAVAGDFVDTRISFIFSDDNLLSGPGESLVNSPEMDFGPRSGLFFPFENLNSQDNTDVTLTHLVVYKEMPGFIDNLTTDAALVARLEVLDSPQTNFRSGDIRLSDGGSYLRARYAIGEPAPYDDEKGLTGTAKRQLDITFFPMNSDRFRAGYTYDLSWGGNRVFTDRKSAFATPGVRLRFDWDGFYALIGAKSTRQLILEKDPTATANRELGAFWGGIAGLGYVHDYFAVESNGGLFDAGRNPKQGVQGETVTAGGVSGRISAFSQGFSPEASIDYRLYRNNADAFVESNFFLRKPKNFDSFTWRASVEGNWLMQTLGDFDKPLATRRVDAFAGAVRADFFIEKLAVNLDFVMRDIYFILFNVPSLDPFLSLPRDSEYTPELMAAIKVEYWLDSINLIPGVLFGVQKPATYRGRVAEVPNASEFSGGKQTVVIPEAGTVIPFPNDREPKEVYSGRASLRWDLSDMLSFIGQMTYTYDRNQLGREKDEVNYTARYYFRKPHILGLAFFAQARF